MNVFQILTDVPYAEFRSQVSKFFNKKIDIDFINFLINDQRIIPFEIYNLK